MNILKDIISIPLVIILSLVLLCFAGIVWVYETVTGKDGVEE